MGYYINQIKTLIWKIYKLRMANKMYFLLEICAPIIFFYAFVMNGRKTTRHYDKLSKTDLVEFASTLSNFQEDTSIGFVFPNEDNETDNLLSMIMDNPLLANNTIKPMKFKNIDELEEYNFKGKGDGSSSSKLLAGVLFENDIYSYTIRINGTLIPNPLDNPITSYGESRHQSKFSADKYLTNYFIPLQIAIDQAIINLKTNSSHNNIDFSYYLGKMSKPEINYTDENSEMKKFGYFYLSILFFGNFTVTLILITAEKEKKTKQGLILAGVSSTSYWLSMWLFTIAMIIIFSVIITAASISTNLFPLINTFLMFLIIFLFGLSQYVMAFATSAFFNSASMADLIGSFVPLVFSIIYLFLGYLPEQLEIVKKIISIFVPQAAFGFTMENIEKVTNESSNHESLSLFNMFESDVGIYFVFLIITNVIYILLAIGLSNYEDNHKFLLKNSKKNISKFKKNIENNEIVNNNNIQELPKDYNGKCMVEVKNIFKTFKKKADVDTNKIEEENVASSSSFWNKINIFKKGNEFYALNDINFKVYENEIFAILGHNGAGKTTLLQIIIGILKPNYGNIYFDGLDIFSNIKYVRQNLGVCSQDNLLYDELTVEDHIKLYAGIKNVEPNYDELLSEIDLVKQRTSKTSVLSGGEKRKLCIGLAILGNPKFVFLDEPTTGLDPLSRRKIWDLLQKKKKSSVIFMSTHYMDEADILADRKLILNNGKINCLGTSLFLKQQFNMKYHLDVETTMKDKVSEIVYKHIPEATFENENSTTTTIEVNTNQEQLNKNQIDKNTDYSCYTWKLPISSTIHFEALLCDLEKYKKSSKYSNGLIKNYALTMPSLEELFIHLEDEIMKNNMKKSMDVAVSINEYKKESFEDDEKDKNQLLVNSCNQLPKLERDKSNSMINKYICLIKFRVKVLFRNISFAMLFIFIPVILAIITFTFINYLSENQNIKFEPKSLSSFEMYNGQQWNYDIENSNMNNTLSMDAIEKVFPKLKNNQNSSSVEYYKIDEMDNVSQSIAEEPYFVSSFSGSEIDNKYTFNIYYNDSMSHSIPSTINALSNAILLSKNVSNTINVKSHPFSYVDSFYIISVSLIACTLIGIILIFGLSLFGPLVVRERVEMILKQLQLNGVSRLNYWISSLIADSSLFLIPCYLIVISGVIYGVEIFRNLTTLLIMVVFMIFWVVASILFQYAFSFIFNKEVSAYSYMNVINMIPIFIGSYGSILVNSFIETEENSFEIFSMATMIFEFVVTVIFPSYGIIGIFSVLFTLQTYDKVMGNVLTFSNLLKLKNNVTPKFIALIISMIVYFIVIIYYDKKKNSISSANINKYSEKEIESTEEKLSSTEEDVYNEYNRVKNDQSEIPIKVLRLNKYYQVKPKKDEERKAEKTENHQEYGEIFSIYKGGYKYFKTAIENITFGINNHECFGLLGPNGAGKSTLLNTITTTIPQSAGQIYYNNKETKDIDVTSLSLGYCPQKDALWKELTLMEHLLFFLKLHGHSEKEAKVYAKQYIKCCNLEEHQNKKVEQMSGGTKRKLSLLIAICSSPSYVVLDEPTAGMDPSSRRFIWNLIKNFTQNNDTSLVLTTHSMEEAEFLCSRIGIIINGMLQCIGSSEHIKLKYGNKYILEVYSDALEKFHKTVIEENQLFGGNDYTYENHSVNYSKYEVVIDSSKIGEIFKKMEQCKAHQIVTDYSFSQISLEQIFINFAKLQKKE